MKKATILLLLCATMFLPNSAMATTQTTKPSSKTVYVCMGNYATAYHAKKDCRGIKNCRAEIKAISESDAIKAKRDPCKICKP